MGAKIGTGNPMSKKKYDSSSDNKNENAIKKYWEEVKRND